jgi:predicted dehydrogenase
MSDLDRITRRSFLRNSSAAVAALGLGSCSQVRPQTAASAVRVIGANDRIVVALIGAGGMGTVNMGACMKEPNVRIGALCDLAEFRIKAAVERTKNQSGGAAEGVYVDYRRILDNKDIDAVIIATPDHWHYRVFLDSIAAGKHVYQQKPMCHTIEQGLEMVRVAKAAPRQVVQIGTQRRSGKQYAKAKELIDSGKLGKVTFIRCWDTRNWVHSDPFKPYPFEGKLDWDRFQEPCKQSQKVKFDPQRYFAWRWYWAYAGGLVNDVGVHVMDVVHWITGNDTPKTAVANGGVYGLKYWETPDVVNCVWDYGTHSVAFLGNFDNGFLNAGITVYGTDATMEIQGFEGHVVVKAEDGKLSTIAEFKPENTSHEGNWINAIRGIENVHAPVELGFQSLLPSLLANLAYRSGRKLAWDPHRQKVVEV